MSHFHRVAIPGAIFDILQNSFNLSASAVTSLSAVFMYSYAISLLLFGVLVDRYGAIRVIMAGAFLFSVGSLIFPNTQNLYFLYLSRAIMGIGSAAFYISLVQEAKKCFPDKYFGISVSLMLITGYMGGVCANVPFIFVLNFISWQKVLNILAIITSIVTLIFIIERLFLNKIAVNEHAEFSLTPFKEVLSNKVNHKLFIFAGLNYGLYYVIQTVIGAKFLKDYVQLSDTAASTILSLMVLVAGASGFILASVSSKMGDRRIIFMKSICIMSSFIFILISLFLLLHLKIKLIAVLLLMIAIGGGMSPLLVPMIHKINKYEIRGTALSVMNCCFFLSVGVLGSLTGYILELFEPIKTSGHIIYSPQSYFWVFLTFFIISLIEMYNVFKLKDV